MIKVILISLLMLLSLNAKSLNWEKSYESAVKKAKEQNKPLFIMVSSPTCPECNYMKKKIFTQDKIKSYINKNFISYQFLHEAKEIPKQMQFWGIPRFYFSKDGQNVYNKAMGGLKADKLLTLLTKSK